jgi:zinc finger CCHC domain-containing protein 9
MAKVDKKSTQKLTKAERKEKYTKKARERRDKANKRKHNTHKICFNCRQRGHTVTECPQSKNAGGEKKTSICYKCGAKDHPLKNCKLLTTHEKELMNSKGGRINYTAIELPFAECYVCKKTGHLSSQCEQNENGLYVKGGGCKQCGSKKHLYQFCPELQKEEEVEKSEDDIVTNVDEFLEDESPVEEGLTNSVKKRQKVVNF